MEKDVLRTWITNGTKNPFYAKKEIVLSELPQKAVIYICGLGQFQLYVNGKKVGNRVLDPAWTDYKKRIYYVTFDITEYLCVGRNSVMAEVGNGWYICDAEGGYFFHFPAFMPPNPNGYKPYGKQLILSAHMELTDVEGNIASYDTDDSWQVRGHEITHSNCYGSEIMDGRRKHLPWTKATMVTGADVPSAQIEEQKIPPVQVIEIYEGVVIGEVNGRTIYDFSQNVSGMLEFEVRGSRGEHIHAYPAEKLAPDGDVDQMAKNWLDINVCETCIIGEDAAWQKFTMKFTYVGGRYVAFDCAPANVKNVKMRAITSATENAGTFSCDNSKFVKIYHMIEKTVEANMLGVHTDCPTIERFAWQEENHLMAPSIMYMKHVKLHWEKFLKDARMAQHTASDFFRNMNGDKIYPGAGLIPSQAPCYIPNVLPVPGLGDFYDIIGWGSSIIIGTYCHYMFYGDVQIIKDNYDAGKRYFEHLKSKVTEDGFINHGLGDWGNPSKIYAKENVETVFLYADAKLLGLFADIFDRHDEAEVFLTYADEIKKNYNERLLTYDAKTGRSCYRVWASKGEIVRTQAAQAMPLYWGMVPKDKEQDVLVSLKEKVEEDGSFVAGEVGHPYIIQVLSEHGMNDLICRMILKPEHPSYYAFIRAGETTLGEYWEENPRSHCHDMMGHIMEWYYNGIAGIKPLKAGFAKVLIKPYLPESVNEVKCTYHSIHGAITVAMKRSAGKVDLQTQTPKTMDVIVDRTFLDG